MSYILDALKKSEMQARQGTLPDLHSHQVMQPAGAQRPGWQSALFGGAAACIVFAIGFVFLSGASDKPAEEQRRTMPATPPMTQAGAPVVMQGQVATTATTLPSPAASPAPATDPTQTTLSQPLPASAPLVNTAVQETMPPQASPAAPVPTTDTPAVSAAQQAAVQPTAAQPTSAQPTVAQPVPEPATQSDRAQAIRMPDLQPQSGNDSPPLMSKLPVSVQESLPPIDISGHIYDEKPASRMAFINGHIQREGDTLPGGLRLLAITPNGVELSFRDTPFRIELFRLPAQQ